MPRCRRTTEVDSRLGRRIGTAARAGARGPFVAVSAPMGTGGIAVRVRLQAEEHEHRPGRRPERGQQVHAEHDFGKNRVALTCSEGRAVARVRELLTEMSAVRRMLMGPPGVLRGSTTTLLARLRLRVGACPAMLGHGFCRGVFGCGGSCSRVTTSRVGSSRLRLAGRASRACPRGDCCRVDCGRRDVVCGRGAGCGQ